MSEWRYWNVGLPMALGHKRGRPEDSTLPLDDGGLHQLRGVWASSRLVKEAELTSAQSQTWPVQ